jgi:protein-tyrosine-phosphatase
VTSVLVLCTGNAARSVICGAALQQRRPDLVIETAGTLTVDGLPVSWRTRAALDAVGVPLPRHASRQADEAHFDVDVVIGLAAEHVAWVRRTHPQAAARTATLARLARELAGGDAPVPHRIRQLDLAGVALEPWEDVADPGGGEVDVFVACAHEIVGLVDALAPRL